MTSWLGQRAALLSWLTKLTKLASSSIGAGVGHLTPDALLLIEFALLKFDVERRVHVAKKLSAFQTNPSDF